MNQSEICACVSSLETGRSLSGGGGVDDVGDVSTSAASDGVDPAVPVSCRGRQSLSTVATTLLCDNLCLKCLP